MENSKMKLKLFVKRLFAFPFFLLLIGCAVRDDMEIPKAVFDKPSSVVIAQMQGLEGAVYKPVSAGLLTALLAPDSLVVGAEQIKSIDPKPIVEENYYRLFTTSFENKKFKTIRYPSILNRGEIVSSTKENSTHTSFDSRFLKDKFGAEYALVLQPKFFGIDRKYHSYGRPWVTAELNVYLIKTQDNTIIGRYTASVITITDKDWDKAPEYESLVETTKDTLKQALQQAHTYFFKGS